MNTRLLLLAAAFVAATCEITSAPFTYQGVLSESGRPAESNYDFRFRLYAVETSGLLLAQPVYVDNVAMRAGHFVAVLDFGDGAFSGADRWLEIAVRQAGTAAEYITLAPRQRITPAPYAIAALNAPAPSSVPPGSTNPMSSVAQSPLRVQGEGNLAAEIRVTASEVLFSSDDAISSDRHGPGLILQAGSGIGPDKNGGNLVLVPGAATGDGRSGRVVIDGAMKVTGSLAATALIADGSGILNLSASNLTGVLRSQQIAGTYANVVELINPSNRYSGSFSGDGTALSNITASAFTGLVPGGSLAGTYSNAVEFNNPANRLNGAFDGTFNGTFGGNGAGLSNVTASALQGILPSAGLSGTYAQALNLANPSNIVAGAFGGDGSGLTHLQASQIAGVLSSEHLEGVYAKTVRFTSPSNEFTGAFAGNGAGLSDVNASRFEGLAREEFAQRHSSNFFSAAQTFAGPVVFSNAVGVEANLNVSGALTAATLSGDGAGIRNVAVSNVMGVLGSGQLQGTYANTVQFTSAANQFTGAFTGNGSGLTSLNASALTGIVPNQTLGGTHSNALNLLNPANIFLGLFRGSGIGLSNLPASNVIGVLSSARLPGLYSNAVQFSNSANQFIGTFAGNGSGLSNIAAAALTGTLPTDLLSGTYNDRLTLGNPLNDIHGAFTGDASRLTNINTASLNGPLPDSLLTGSYNNPVVMANSENIFVGYFLGDGGGLNNLDASTLANGTVPDTRLSANVALLNSNPTFSGSVTAEGDLLAARVSAGSVGINTTNPVGRALLVNGATGITGTNALEFGANVAGKHVHAGKIGYQTFTPGALDIVGAGTNLGSRKIKFWAESGAAFHCSGSNALLTVSNTLDEPSSVVLATPFSSWRVGQNKPPDKPDAFDSFFIYQQAAARTRLLITDTGRVGIGTNSPAHPLHMGNGAHCTAGGVWTSVSDRAAKEDFRPVEPREVLAKVAALPLSEWKYKAETNGVRHLGPMAQDFHAAFGLGESDRTIGSVDADGVALAAIQGLSQIISEKDAEIRELKAKHAELEKKMGKVEEFLALIKEGTHRAAQ